MRRLCVVVLQFIFISISFCDFTENKDKYLSAFVNHLNSFPDQITVYDKAYLVKLEKNDNDYYIEVKVKATDQKRYSTKYQNCTGKLTDGEDGQVSIFDVECSDSIESWTETMEELVTDVTTNEGPIQLENEVQSDSNMSTSGERFIAVPRDHPTPCIGCASFVDTNAAGVKELAGLAINQLNRRAPNLRHSLNNVISVERQVQVVGGVRYIMNLAVDYDNCTSNDAEDCNFQKACKVAVLEKPWQRVADGSKFRAIVSNNCTEEWLYDENNDQNNNINPAADNYDNSHLTTPEYEQTGASEDSLIAKHNSETQAQPNAEKSLTDDQLRELEEQIIPISSLNRPTDNNYYATSDANRDAHLTEEKAEKLGDAKPSDDFASTQQPDAGKTPLGLPEEKKKAIEELMNFFDFSGLNGKLNNEELIRMKRDYGSELQMLNLAESYQDMKTKLKNAQFIHRLAQAMVDHLNEIDIEVKNRVLKEVISAEEEKENDLRYFYVQARVTIPCDNAQCKDRKAKICNGIIDGTGDEPSVLYTVCNDDRKKGLGEIKDVRDDDPILLKFLRRAMRRIDEESKIPYALRVRKILSASTQKVSGVLTKISVEIEYTECFKTVPLFKRNNCSAIENLGYKLCDIEVLERHWLKESKITYVCTERPVDEIFVSNTGNDGNARSTLSVDDPQVLEILQEALQYLETKSNRNNKQKIVEVKSVSTQQVAGMLTDIAFTVGYTVCNSEYKDDVSTCELLNNEPLRHCSVEVWDRPWLENQKQLHVSCETSTGKSMLVGNPLEKDVDDTQYKSLAEESLQKYLKESAISQHYELIKIDKVTVQIVSGTLTTIDFHISPTNCKVDTDGQPSSTNCVVQNLDEIVTCRSKIWDRPWLNSDSNHIEVNCNLKNEKSRRKRSIQTTNNEIEQNPDSFKNLADDCLTNYMATYGIDKHHKVIRITKAVKVNVTGDLTKIDFVAAPTNCSVKGGYPTSSLCEINDIENTLSCHADIWVKPFLNIKFMNVDCQIDEAKVRKKRQLGGPKLKDKTNPKYRALAEKALTKYVRKSRISQYHDVVFIENVTEQIVSGVKTKIRFTASPTNCQIDKHGKPTLHKCELTRMDTILRCDAEIVSQPWLGKEDISVNCLPSRSREKRSQPGGIAEQDISDPKYMQLADESLAQYVATTGATQEHKIARITKVTTQVVAGTLTKLNFDVQSQDHVLNCHSEIWERPWLKNKEIKVNCSLATTSRKKREVKQRGHLKQQDVNNPKYEKPRKKRSIKLGGISEQDVSDPKYMQLAKESLAQYIATNGATQEHNITRITKVTTQVVAGIKTNVYFDVQSQDHVLNCHSEIWEQPWLKKKEIKVNCSPATTSRKKREVKQWGHLKQQDVNDPKYEKPRKKRFILGGISEQDISDPKYMQLAKESLALYIATNGATQEHNNTRITKVTTQVASGTLTKLEFDVQSQDHVLNCHSEIWEQPWLKKKEITVNCHPPKSRRRREIQLASAVRNLERYQSRNNRAGGYREEDPTETKYTQMVEEALRKYDRRKKSKLLHKVIEVKRISSQVVSGKKYKIDFTAALTTCASNVSNVALCNAVNNSATLYCRTEIWDQPWKKTRDIKVVCTTEDSDEESDSSDEEEGNNIIKRSVSNEIVRNNTVVTDKPRELVIPIEDLNENRPTTEQNKPEDNIIFSKNKLYNSKRYLELAEDSLREYESLSKADVVYKVVNIHYVNEDDDVGIRIRLEFTAAPANCSLPEHLNNKDCQFVEPKELVSCHADIRFTLLLEANFARSIEVECTKQQKKNTRHTREIQTEEYVEDDVAYYYAESAVDKHNSMTDEGHLYKLITVHDVRRTVHMKVPMVRLYIQIAQTYCLRDQSRNAYAFCNEIDGYTHSLCYVRVWPSRYDDLAIEKVDVVCEKDIRKFTALTGFNVFELLEASMLVLNNRGNFTRFYRVIPGVMPHLIPTLDYKEPFRMIFLVGVTNCTTEYAESLRRQDELDLYSCVLLEEPTPTRCAALIYMTVNSRELSYVNVTCAMAPSYRSKRSVPMRPDDITNQDVTIQKFVQESLEKLEMISVNNYKQRVLVINRYSTKFSNRKETTIDFDVGYTNCLKFEWVDNITSCEFLEHLPRRHCVSIVYEKLWLENSREIKVECADDETPLEANMGFDTAQSATVLSNEALKHIEYKYPHPRRQKVVRIFSFEQQMVAGIHYRMTMEVGFTKCVALSIEDNCELDPEIQPRKFCRVNVWVRSWTNHPPSYRVNCDYQDGSTSEVYHELQTEHLFSHFLATYRPSYINDHEEMRHRYSIFKENIRKIHELNVYEMGTARYAVTRSADMSAEEFRAKFLGLDPKLRDENQVPMPEAEIPSLSIPDAFDWRDHDAVTEVKDQGMCGSCWAFSVTGNIEGQWKRHSGKLVSLSEQELVDCDKLDEGCNGGLPDNAYRAIEQLGGLETETDYPYEGEDDKCAYNASLSRVQISGAVNISSNETDMAKWLVKNGPISIGINANAMQFYVGGVSHPWKMLCNPSNLDHGVLIVGYGEKDYPLFHKKLPYWIVKNSWGKSWGEQGYYRVYRGDGTCGLNMMASSAVV